MKLELITKDRAASDPRFRINVFEGVANPLDPKGDGYEIDLFAVMSEAIIRMPDARDAVFVADQEAADLIGRQWQPKDPSLIPLRKFRGCHVEIANG